LATRRARREIIPVDRKKKGVPLSFHRRGGGGGKGKREKKGNILCVHLGRRGGRGEQEGQVVRICGPHPVGEGGGKRRREPIDPSRLTEEAGKEGTKKKEKQSLLPPCRNRRGKNRGKPDRTRFLSARGLNAGGEGGEKKEKEEKITSG